MIYRARKSAVEHRSSQAVELRRPIESRKSWATRTSVLSLAGICGLYAEVTSGSSGVGLPLCAALALLSGSAAAAIWATLLSEQTDFPYPLDPDEDSQGDGGGSGPPITPNGGVELRWTIFERDFGEYVNRRAPSDRSLERIRG